MRCSRWRYSIVGCQRIRSLAVQSVPLGTCRLYVRFNPFAWLITECVEISSVANTKTGFLVALWYVFIGNRDTVAVTQGSVVRRIDFDPGLIELILNILMEVGIDRQHILWLCREGIQLIRDIEVLQISLQYKRSGRLQNIAGRQSCINKQFVNSFPRRIIPNRNGGMENHSVLATLRTVVQTNPTHNPATMNRSNPFFFLATP